MVSPQASVVRFGPFHFDTRTGDVWTDDRRVRLQDQPRQVLALLVSRPAALVTREELRHALWPDDTFVDFDTGINVAVAKLRQVLEDSAAQPKFIETLPRKGYRFLPPVLPAAVSDRETKARPVTRKLASRTVAAAAAVLVVAIAASAWRLGDRSTGAAARRIETLAVLPFENLLGDPARDYFVAGLTDTLVTDLASLGQPRVLARQSARLYAATKQSAQQIAGALSVDALVHGSIVATRTGFAVNLRVVDGRTGQYLFADRFERADWDLVEVPGELLEGLARAVGATAVPNAAARASRTRAVVPEALHPYLRARYFWSKRGDDNERRAVDHLTTALRVQPAFPMAWAALADVYAAEGSNPSTPLISPWPADPVDAGITAAEQALKLDPALGEAHAALGRLYMLKWRWDDALAEARRGVELSPMYATGRQWLGTLLMRLGRCPDALVQVQEGARLDPLTPLVNEAVGSVYMNCGEPQRAIQIIRALIDMFPDVTSHRVRLGNAYAYAGEHDRAIEAYRRVSTMATGAVPITANLAYSLAASGRIPEARALVADMEREARRGRMSAYQLAVGYAGIDDRERTFTALERAYERRDIELAGLILQRRFWKFRNDPRYQRLLARVGLLPYSQAARLTLRESPR